MRCHSLSIEQSVLREFRRLREPPQRVILALSGGLDSMSMAQILWSWRANLKLDLAVAHVHHGEHPERTQRQFRDRATVLVRQWAEERKLPFFSNEVQGSVGSSESALRLYRENYLSEWRQQFSAHAIAYAHHRDDLLETRMIRLIRGSGGQGLRAMSHWQNGKWRPLLALGRAQIASYAESKTLTWLEDPSNTKLDALRNWLRHSWLPGLEEKRPGALSSLARSLETLLPPNDATAWSTANIPYVGLRRELFARGSPELARELLANYLKALQLNGYGQTHIDEIIKRLTTARKNFAFELLGVKFTVSPDFLWASRV